MAAASLTIPLICPTCLSHFFARSSAGKQAQSEVGEVKVCCRLCYPAGRRQSGCEVRAFCRDAWEFSILGRSKQQNLSAWWLVAASSCRLLGSPRGGVFLVKCILVKQVVQRKYNRPRGVFAPQLQSQLHRYVEIWNKQQTVWALRWIRR